MNSELRIEDYKGIVLVNYWESGHTITCQYYGILLSHEIIFYRDNTICNAGIQVVQHPHSPNF